MAAGAVVAVEKPLVAVHSGLLNSVGLADRFRYPHTIVTAGHTASS